MDFQASAKHRFFVRWLKSSFLEDAQDYTYETETGLMEWDEKRPAYTVAADWTYAMSATTVLNVTVDTNGFLQQNQRLGTRQYKPDRRRPAGIYGREVRRQAACCRGSSGPA